MAFVIRMDYGDRSGDGSCYYAGKTHQYGGIKMPTGTEIGNSEMPPKVYSTERRANAAKTSLEQRFDLMYSFTVEELA